ncbi:MAG: hypothetical protein KGI41_03905, partial [Patescibacteria group bacterium]|nr:hypothetical protein [Patescibacteria group bacterium]
GVELQYLDANGVKQTTGPGLMTTYSSAATTTVQFTGLNFYVPMNDSSDVTVLVNTPTIASGGNVAGTKIQVALNRSTNFQAVNSAGTASTTAFASTNPISYGTAGYGTLVLHKTVPAFLGQSYSTSATPTSGSDMYDFTISADTAGPVEIDGLAFNTATSTMSASGFQLFDQANPSVALNATGVNADNNGNVKIVPDQVISIPAGSSKTFSLKAATISGWASGASIVVKFATPSSTWYAGTTASGVAGNGYVWSDRSATSHSTSTSDWFNGYLLRDLVSGVYSYTHS